MPTGPIGADFELSRERTLGDLAVNGGPGQPGPGEDSFQTDDTVFSNRRVLRSSTSEPPTWVAFDVFSRPALLSGIGMKPSHYGVQ